MPVKKEFSAYFDNALEAAYFGNGKKLRKECTEASAFACTLDERTSVYDASVVMEKIASSARMEAFLKGGMREALKGDVVATENQLDYAKRVAHDSGIAGSDSKIQFPDDRGERILGASYAIRMENEFKRWHKMEGKPVEEIEKSMDVYREKVKGFSDAEKRLVGKKISAFMHGVYLSGIEEEMKKAYGSDEMDAHVCKALEYAEKMGMNENDISIIKFRAERMKRL